MSRLFFIIVKNLTTNFARVYIKLILLCPSLTLNVQKLDSMFLYYSEHGHKFILSQSHIRCTVFYFINLHKVMFIK